MNPPPSGERSRLHPFDFGSQVALGDGIAPSAWTFEMLYCGYSAPMGVALHWAAPDPLYASIPQADEKPKLYLGPQNWAEWPAQPMTDYRDGNWHHLAFTMPGGDQYDIIDAGFYVDGSMETMESYDDSGMPQSKNHPLYLGMVDWSAMGTWDEVRICDWEQDSTRIRFTACNLLSSDNELTWGAEQ